MNPLDISDDYPKDKGSGDDDLWDQAMRDVKPIKSSSRIVPVKASATARKSRPPVTEKAPTPVPVRRAQPGDNEVDGSTGRKLKRGAYPIDLTLDLHGLTQVAAHKKLRETVIRAHSRQLRCLLVITGKGRGQDGGAGVLKRQVPVWLQGDDLRGIVLKTEAAQPEHGGGGALYVLLRRTRTKADH